MPERAQRLLRYLTLRDGLTRYGTLDGIASTLEAMAVRTPAAQALVGAERVMSEHLDDFVAECSSFLADIRTHLARENG
ncbi:MAG TPA: ACP phosphodiesterase, partial [Flavobacteriales bacterium]|nr:ACP phosphodiesterase [Flavobacteriales bacterium]